MNKNEPSMDEHETKRISRVATGRRRRQPASRLNQTLWSCNGGIKKTRTSTENAGFYGVSRRRNFLN